jgi:hypothetical protein
MQTVILQLLQWALSVVRSRRIGRCTVGNGVDAKGLFIGFPRPAVNRGSRTSGAGGERTIDSERRHGQAEGSVRKDGGKLPGEIKRAWRQAPTGQLFVHP